MDDQIMDHDRVKIIIAMHAIWSSRNRWTHDQPAYDPVHAFKTLCYYLLLLEFPKPVRGVLGLQWRPPDAGWIKINTDGAINTEASCAGGGGVARSHLSFMGAWSKSFPGVSDPFVAEALALREGVIFAQLRGFSHVVMEVDCLKVVNLWSSRDSSRSIVAHILDEIREKSLSFISFSIRHVPREVNTLADLCAKKASA